MAGIKDLKVLLKSMKPKLAKPHYTFCTVSDTKFAELNLFPLMAFREKEGITIIIRKDTADAYNLTHDGEWAMITLNVHSDLAAVGFLASITNKLAKAKISVNAVSAYYHDHLFVPAGKAKKAMEVLKKL